MNIVVTGGTGFIGKYLTQRLSELGHKIWILSREAKSSQNENIQFFTYGKNHQFPDFQLNIDAIINLAGAPIADKSWTQSYKKEIIDSRVQTTKACVDFIKNSAIKPKVLISSSAVGYYGTKNPQVHHENAPHGTDFLAKTAIAWENEALKSEIRTVLLRTGIVLGTDGGALPQILTPFKFYAGGHIGDGKQGFPWIHIKDAVNLIIWAIENDNVSGPLNIVAPETINNGQFTKVLGKVLHKPSGLPVPAFMIKTMLGERALLLLEGQKVYPQKAIDLGFHFEFPTAESALTNLLVK